MIPQAEEPQAQSAPTIAQSLASAPPASVAVWAIALMGAVALLKWASAFFVPLAASVMLFYALDPIVEAMVSRRVPRSAAAAVAVVMMSLLGGLGVGIYAGSDDVDQLMEALPNVVAKLREAGASAQESRAPARWAWCARRRSNWSERPKRRRRPIQGRASLRPRACSA